MDKNICNICGGGYVYKNGKWICSCCDNIRQDEITNEELVLLFNAATKLRMADFDSAEELYTDFVKKYPKNSEGYWGLLLSKYGIKYEDDYDGKKVPTVYATSIESILNDENYKKALAYADKETEKYYKQQANKFETIRQEWVEKASKEQPVDIFICYKDSDEERDIARTDDSYEAQNLYTYLMSKGYSVFFSRESLRDKVAEKYEPYIFNALNTAHVMIVYSSSKEYLESTWVKNEWTRFFKKIKNKQKQDNSLILAYDKMKPSEFPKVFSSVQCMNASQKTFYEDLEKHIQKVIKRANAPVTKLERVEIKENVKHKKAKKLDKNIVKREIGTYNVEQLTGNDETQLKTAYKFLSRGLFNDADEIITKILEKNSKNGQAIIGKMLVNLEAKSVEEIEQHITEDTDLEEIENAIGYSDKDFALKILNAVKNASLREFDCDNTEFALQLFDFVCQYDVEDLAFLNKSNDVFTHLVIKDEIENANTLIKYILKTLTHDTDKYLEELNKFVDVFRKQGRFEDANHYADEYLEISPTSDFMLWKKLGIELQAKDENEVTYNIHKLEKTDLFERILACLKAGEERHKYIDRILAHIQGCASWITNDADFKKCCAVFDKIIKYTAQDDKYNQVIYDYAEMCQNKEQFTFAEKYYAIVISEDGQNHNAYWKLLQAKLKVKNNKELIEQPIIVTTMSEFHSAIVAAGDDEKSVDRYIDLKAKQLEYIEKQKVIKAKKKQQKKIITIFAVCISLVLAVCAGFYGWKLYYNSQNQLLFELDNGTYTVKAGKFYDEKYITIPETYNGKLVTNIDQNAFKDKNVEVIRIPSSIETIENNAFNGCDNLTKVEFYSNARTLSDISQMKSIGDYAFYGCSDLENFEFSNSLTYLGKYAFANCSSLNEITIPTSLKNILEGTFKNSFNNVESISIPKEIEFIGKDAFNCNVENILVDERNSIPTNWATDWFGTSSESEVLWSIPVYFEYTYATGDIGKNKISVVYGKSYDCPVPSRNGYSFAGWYLNDTQYTGPDGLSIVNWSESSAITLKPKWNANNNSIVFNGNGATSGEMANQIIATDSSANLNNNLFVRNGYTFAGWSTTSNGEVEFEDGDTYAMGTNSSYNLYAVWTPNTNEIIFNPNGATSGTMSNQLIKTDHSADLNANLYVKTGYDFKGWSIIRDGIVAYNNGATFTMGANATQTLYAVWEAINYNVNVDLDGGNIQDFDNSFVYTIESENILIPQPIKAGYTFVGWTGINISNVIMNLIIEQGTYGNLSYKANWQANTNEIIFNPNGATSGEMVNQQAKTDETITLNSCEYLKEEYFFVGWATSPEGEVEYVNGATYIMGPNSSYTLYAKWALSPTQITFNGNGATSGEMSEISVERNSNLKVPKNKFTRNGYTFIGWSTVYDGEVELEDEGNFEVVATTYCLHAIWEANTNMIMFNGNGSTSGSMNIQYAKTDEIIALQNNEFVKDYYMFVGWSTTSNGYVEFADGDNFTMGTNSSYTLYAIWEERIRFIDSAENLNIIKEDLDNDILAKYMFYDNIDCNGAELTTIGTEEKPFVGKIQGNNYSISNFVINDNTSKNIGFIGYNQGEIHNLKLSNFTINATTSQEAFVGSLCGTNNGNIKNCSVIGELTVTHKDGYQSNNVGGLIGANYNQVERANSSVKIIIDFDKTSCSHDDDFSFGGLIGYNASNITNCYYSGNLMIISDSYGGELNIGGLLGYTSDAEIDKSYSLGNISINIPHVDYVNIAGFVGHAELSYIEDCFSDMSVVCNFETSGGLYSAGFVADLTSSNVLNCYSSGEVKTTSGGYEHTAGFVAYLHPRSDLEDSRIEYSYTSTDVISSGTYHDYIARFWASGYSAYITNCYALDTQYIYNATANISKSESIKTISEINEIMAAKWDSNIWQFIEGYNPLFKNMSHIVFNGNGATSGSMKTQVVKKGDIINLKSNQYEKQYNRFLGWATSPNGEVVYDDGDIINIGSTQALQLYAIWGRQIKEINSAEGLNSIRADVEAGMDYYTEYVLTCDIDLNNEEWIPIGRRESSHPYDTIAFDGIFNGNGCKISNLKISSYHNGSGYFGLFGINSGTIKNVEINNLNITLKAEEAGVYVGSIVALNYGLILNCSASGQISLTPMLVASRDICIGGIVDNNTESGKIVNCYSKVKINAETNSYSYVGGIASRNAGMIENCYSSNEINAWGNRSSIDIKIYAGGIVGMNYECGNISNCVAVANVSTLSAHSYYGYAGGIVGFDNNDKGIYNNNYRSSEQVVTIRMPGIGISIEINQEGTKISLEEIKTTNFIFNTLNWSSDVWEVTNGSLPNLK